MKPRPHRWLSIPDVTDLVLARSNRVAERLKKLPRRYQVQHVRRLVLRAERRDEVKLTKRHGGDIYVRFDALENLLPVDSATITKLEVDVVRVAADNRQIWRHVGGHGTQLRDHAKRLTKVEKKTELIAKLQAELAAIDMAD